MRHYFEGKEKLATFGAYPALSLAEAIAKRAEARTHLAQGIDPRAHEDAEKEEAKAISEDTFSRIAAELMEKLTKEGKAETTLRKKQWYLNMANADFADMPIRDLSSAIILKTLRKVEGKGNYETAQRLRSTIGQVCRYAIATAQSSSVRMLCETCATIMHRRHSWARIGGLAAVLRLTTSEAFRDLIETRLPCLNVHFEKDE